MERLTWDCGGLAQESPRKMRGLPGCSLSAQGILGGPTPQTPKTSLCPEPLVALDPPVLSVGVARERRGPAGLARENRVTRHK